MVYILIQHKVKDFSKWKPYFDQNEPERKANGSQEGRVFHSVDDPNMVTLLFSWDSIENARQFAKSDKLHDVMQQAGVIGEPTVNFLKEIEKTTE